MTKDQKAKIRHFISRPSMYVYDLDKKQIVAFVNGLEASDNTLGFTTQISNLIKTTYDIKANALGWPQQVQRFADRQAVDWWTAFKF